MSVCQYPQIQPVVIYIQKRRETQLQTSGARKPQSVGFLSVFCLTCHLWKGLSLVLLLSVLGVSVQPNLREDTVFS